MGTCVPFGLSPLRNVISFSYIPPSFLCVMLPNKADKPNQTKPNCMMLVHVKFYSLTLALPISKGSSFL